MVSSSCRNSSCLPAILRVVLASSSSCLNHSSWCSNVMWSHYVGRNCGICRYLSCHCRLIWWPGWSHTICTSWMGWEWCATLVSTTCGCLNASIRSSDQNPFLWMLMNDIMDSWSARASAPLSVPLICTLQSNRHIYQCHLYQSSCEWVRVGGLTTYVAIGTGYAFVASAGVCPSVQSVSNSICPSHLGAISGFKFNPTWAPQYLVQRCLNTGSSTLSLLCIRLHTSNKDSSGRERRIVHKNQCPSWDSLFLFSVDHWYIEKRLTMQIQTKEKRLRQGENNPFGRYSYYCTFVSKYGDWWGYFRKSNCVICLWRSMQLSLPCN